MVASNSLVVPAERERSDLLEPAFGFAPKPTCIEDTGLPQLFLADLIAKHLSASGVLDIVALTKRLCLPGSIVEDVLSFMRTEGLVELRAVRNQSLLLRFGLTDRGRTLANDALQRDGYLGPAPVPLDVYDKSVTAQSGTKFPVNRDRVHEAFADTVIRRELLDSLGPAMSSGRSLFIYGHSGTGKSYIARRLTRLLGPPVILPHAILVGESVIAYFDANAHRAVPMPETARTAMFSDGFDARFILCERPFVSSGGELTIDQLELQYEPSTRRYAAPLQMRANMGMLLIDDLGRQRVSTADLFNRWIVPLEEKRDQLAMNSGRHFSTPFDVVLVFSTNLDPHKLADDAFLRRIGYKIGFQVSSSEEYAAIWRQVCAKNAIAHASDLVDFVLTDLYANSEIPRLACHPRDLLGLAEDCLRYTDGDEIGEEEIRWAWGNYFVEI